MIQFHFYFQKQYDLFQNLFYMKYKTDYCHNDVKKKTQFRKNYEI